MTLVGEDEGKSADEILVQCSVQNVDAVVEQLITPQQTEPKDADSDAFEEAQETVNTRKTVDKQNTVSKKRRTYSLTRCASKTASPRAGKCEACGQRSPQERIFPDSQGNQRTAY